MAGICRRAAIPDDGEDLFIAAPQGLHGGFDAAVDEVLLDGHPDVTFEGAAEVTPAQPATGAQVVKGDGLRAVFIEKV